MPPMSPRAITPFPPKGRPGAGLRRAGAEPVRCPRCPAAAGCFGGSRDPPMQPPGEQHCGACRCPRWAGIAGGWWSWGAGHGGVNPWGPHPPHTPKLLGCPKTFGIPMGAGGCCFGSGIALWHVENVTVAPGPPPVPWQQGFGGPHLQVGCNHESSAGVLVLSTRLWGPQNGSVPIPCSPGAARRVWGG